MNIENAHFTDTLSAQRGRFRCALYANNFLTIAPRHIMAVAGQSETLQQRFRDAGVTVEWVPLESLIDGFGAAHCMTQVLQREAYEGNTPTGIRQINTVKTDDQTIYNLSRYLYQKCT